MAWFLGSLCFLQPQRLLPTRMPSTHGASGLDAALSLKSPSVLAATPPGHRRTSCPLPTSLGSPWRVSNLYVSVPLVSIRHYFPLNIQGPCIISHLYINTHYSFCFCVYSIQVEANRSPQ